MPGPDGILTLALDFDGTLVEPAPGGVLRWRRNGKEFLLGSLAAGMKVVVHTCRATLVGYRELPGDAEEFYRSGRVPEDVLTSWRLREEMEAFLRAEGVRGLFELWEGPGKPLADFYVDDKAEQPADFVALAGELGIALVHAGSQGREAVGVVGPAAPGAAAAPAGPVGTAPR